VIRIALVSAIVVIVVGEERFTLLSRLSIIKVLLMRKGF
jgi:hypothetical protein